MSRLPCLRCGFLVVGAELRRIDSRSCRCGLILRRRLNLFCVCAVCFLRAAHSRRVWATAAGRCAPCARTASKRRPTASARPAAKVPSLAFGCALAVAACAALVLPPLAVLFAVPAEAAAALVRVALKPRAAFSQVAELCVVSAQACRRPPSSCCSPWSSCWRWRSSTQVLTSVNFVWRAACLGWLLDMCVQCARVMICHSPAAVFPSCSVTRLLASRPLWASG